MGPDKDINLIRYFAIIDLSLIDDTSCGSVVITYPGQTVYFDSNNIDSSSGCLDLEA
jgi:hypothetical protein